MEITYTYMIKRKDFGKQPMFSEARVQLIDSIDTDKSEYKKYCLRNPVHREVQETTPQSECYVNTIRAVMREQGMNHLEGGWPKDVNILDEEATSRYRRRIERDDAYVDAILKTYPRFSHYIKQNNAIEMYQMFFKGMAPEQPIEKSAVIVKNVYRDRDLFRPISSIAWTIEDDPKLVVAYCNRSYPTAGPVNKHLTCYMWNIEDPNRPSHIFDVPSACWKNACSPVNPNIILGGLANGRICIFDIRETKLLHFMHEPVAYTPMHLAHRDPVNSVLFIHSRINTEFFSGSTDGKCMWWDIRNLSNVTDEIVMSARCPPGHQPHQGNAEPVSTLQFDRNVPTRFLCGTDTGLVVNVNRKGKTVDEIMSTVYEAHNGPVRAVHRSPAIAKMFLTCGDWTCHIYSDEVPTSPIITGTPHRHQVTDAIWAPQRVSGYMTINADGKFRYWDLLRKYREPIITSRIAKDPLLRMAAHEEGRLVAVGSEVGAIYLLNLTENLVFSGERDKPLMLQTYERETRRERILETRIKEIRLKLREEESVGIQTVEEVDEEALVRDAEENYKKMVLDEMRRAGVTYYEKPGRKMRER